MSELAFVLAYVVPAFGAAVGIGIIGGAALNAFGRNPEQLGQVRQLMILAIVFCDSLAIIGIIVAFIAKAVA